MDGGVVPDYQKMISYLPYQVDKKLDGVQTVQALLAYHRVNLAFECQGAHNREMVVGLPFFQDRCVSSWSIGLDHTRQEVEARFIHENEIKTQKSGFLL